MCFLHKSAICALPVLFVLWKRGPTRKFKQVLAGSVIIFLKYTNIFQHIRSFFSVNTIDVLSSNVYLCRCVTYTTLVLRKSYPKQTKSFGRLFRLSSDSELNLPSAFSRQVFICPIPLQPKFLMRLHEISYHHIFL